MNSNPRGSSRTVRLRSARCIGRHLAALATLACGVLSAQTSIRLVRDIRPGATGSFPTWLTDFNGVLHFRASNGGLGYETWRSNGTSAGTSLLFDAFTGAAHGNPFAFAPTDDVLYYKSIVAAGSLAFVVHDRSGTRLLQWPFIDSFNGAAGLNGRVFFTASDTTLLSRQLFVSDGTAAGTHLLPVPGLTSGVHVRELLTVGQHVYFAAASFGSGIPLVFRTDGNTVTQFIQLSSLIDFVSDLRDYGNRLACVGETIDAQNAKTLSLWVDGVRVQTLSSGPVGAQPEYLEGFLTVAGESIYANIRPAGGTPYLACWSPARGLTSIGRDAQPVGAVGDLLYFADDDGSGIGRELWVTDGTAAGTRLVADINPGPSSSSPRAPTYSTLSVPPRTVSTRYALFVADDGVHGVEWWISDGSTSGTRLIGDVEPGAGSTIPGGPATLSGGTIFVSAGNAAVGHEPYVVDLGATVQPIRGGCTATDDPLLRGTDPVLGATSTWSGARAPASIGVVLLGSVDRPGQLYAPGCRLVVDLTRPFADVFVFPVGGAWSLGVPVPNDPGLDAALLGVQAAFPDAGAPLGLRFTNGLLLRLGR